MPVRIQLSHILRKYAPDYDHNTGILLEDAAGGSVRQIIERLAIPPGEVVTVIVNSYPATPASMVQEGDTVTLTKVIGGG
jgi:sulfur carrier protein ThiS